jgi:hypothetical protein
VIGKYYKHTVSGDLNFAKEKENPLRKDLIKALREVKDNKKVRDRIADAFEEKN